jgi:hypothetical protein
MSVTREEDPPDSEEATTSILDSFSFLPASLAFPNGRPDGYRDAARGARGVRSNPRVESPHEPRHPLAPTMEIVEICQGVTYRADVRDR